MTTNAEIGMNPEEPIVTLEQGVEFYESMRSTGIYLQCWKIEDGETHWVAAKTREGALQVVVKVFGMQNVEEYQRDFEPEVTALPYGQMLTVRDESDGTKETKSVAEWIFPLKEDEIICTSAAW